jgi:hypothetical protein
MLRDVNLRSSSTRSGTVLIEVVRRSAAPIKLTLLITIERFQLIADARWLLRLRVLRLLRILVLKVHSRENV